MSIVIIMDQLSDLNITDDGRPVGVRVERGAAVVAEEVEPAAHPSLFAASCESGKKYCLKVIQFLLQVCNKLSKLSCKSEIVIIY
jgi:hypothetical protein